MHQSSSFLLDTNNTSPGHDFLISSNAVNSDSLVQTSPVLLPATIHPLTQPLNSPALLSTSILNSLESIALTSMHFSSPQKFVQNLDHNEPADNQNSESSESVKSSESAESLDFLHPDMLSLLSDDSIFPHDESLSPVNDELTLYTRQTSSQTPIPPSIRAALGIASSIGSALADPTIHDIFQHYLEFTCPSLDPANPDVMCNSSTQYYLPVAVNSLSCFHGLLAVSAMQLREGNSFYGESAQRHRTLSFQYLSKEIQEKKQLHDTHVLGGILCQLTLDVMEVKSEEWRVHLNACRNTVKCLLSQARDYVTWFLTARITKYDTFASFIDCHKPIIPLKSLDDISLCANFDSIWAVPTKWSVYCGYISYWSTQHHAVNTDTDTDEKHNEMTYIEDKINECKPFHVDLLTTTLDTQIQIIWQISTFIHYTRMTSTVRLDLVPEVRAAFQIAVDVLKSFPNTDFRGTAFSWPLFVLVSAAFTSEERTALEAIISDFWRFLRIASFGEILSISKSLWSLDYTNTTAEVYNAHVQSHLTILLA